MIDSNPKANRVDFHHLFKPMKYQNLPIPNSSPRLENPSRSQFMGSSRSGLLRSLLLGLTLGLGSQVCHASLIAEEGFDYPAGTPLAGKTGPLGFSGPYTASNSGLTISAGGSSYGDLSISGNKLAFSGTTNNGNFGSLSNSPETPGTTVYMSYLMQADPNSGYAGVSLFNGNDEVLFTGKRSGTPNVFGLEPKDGTSENSGVHCTRLSLVVCRIDFESDSATIRMYLNPQSPEEPGTADVTVTRNSALVYDSVRFQSSNANGSVDEFRLGDTFADVAPLTFGSIPSEVVVLGSSVAAGTGASPQSNGWAYRLEALLEQPPAEIPDSRAAWTVFNASIGGDTTSKVLNRFNNDVAIPRAGADIVMIGLSLANEGLVGSSNPQPVFDSFKNGLTEIISRCRAEGFYPVITLCYPQNQYNSQQYAFVRKMNVLINSWDVPSVNFLGAIDDGNGHWVPGYSADDGHPNSQGHLELYSSIVPTFFDAVIAGKTDIPSWDGTTGYLRLQQDAGSPSPLTFTPGHDYRSLTLSYRLRTTGTGSIAAIESGTTGATMEIREGSLVYISPTGVETTIPTTLNDGRWHDLAISHRKPSSQTLLFVDGQLMATVSGSLTAETFVVGGPGSTAGRAAAPLEADFQDVAIYRAAWTEDEALAQSSGALQQASLDVLATLDDATPAQGAALDNEAQSAEQMVLETSSFTVSAVMTTPDGLTASSYVPGTVSLAWVDHAGGSASFTIERRQTGVAEDWTVVATTPGNTPFYEDAGLTAGTSYDYRISIPEGSLQGDYSNVVSIAPAGQDSISYGDWIAGYYQPEEEDASILVDFNASGAPDYGGVVWNTVSSPSDPTPIALRDTADVDTGITVSVSDAFDQTRNDAGSTFSAYATSAQSTIFALRDDVPLAGAITFAGLDPAMTYDFSFFARRGSLVGGFDYSGVYTFTGGGDPVEIIVNAANNTSLAHALAVAPDASGVVTLTITPGPGTGTDFPVINFLKLEKSRPGVHLVDFNTNAGPNYGGVTWTTVNTTAASGPYALQDIYGTDSGFSLSMSDGFDQFRNDAINNLPDFAAAAQGSQFALRDDSPLTASMTFTGLDPEVGYDFSFFARRGSLVGGFDYSGTYTFTGAGDPVVVVTDGAVNTTLTEVPTVTPDASGSVTLTITAGPLGGTDFPVLNFIRFEATQVSPAYLALIDPDADPDNDGISNFEEYARGFDPTVADGTPFEVESFGHDASATTLEISRDRRASDAILTLETSTDLLEWVEDETVPTVLGTDGSVESLRFEPPTAGDLRFYRFVLSQP